MFVVKPTYFRDADGVTVRSLHLVYDTDNPLHDTANGLTYLVPNYAIAGRDNVVSLLTAHFDRKGIPASQWRLTPPTFRSIDDLGSYLGDAQVVDD